MKNRYDIVGDKLKRKAKVPNNFGTWSTSYSYEYPNKFHDISIIKDGKMCIQTVPINPFISPDEEIRFWQGCM